MLEKTHYSTGEIAQIANVSPSCIKERIRRLEIFPDFVHGKRRLFNTEKVQCIISQFKYHKRVYYLILESKINYDTEI